MDPNNPYTAGGQPNPEARAGVEGGTLSFEDKLKLFNKDPTKQDQSPTKYTSASFYTPYTSSYQTPGGSYVGSQPTTSTTTTSVETSFADYKPVNADPYQYRVPDPSSNSFLLQQDLATAKRREQDLLRDNEIIKNDLAKSLREKADTERNLEENRKQVYELTQQISANVDRLRNMDSVLAEANRAKEEYQGQINKLSGQLIAMVSREDFESAKRKADDLERERGYLQGEIENARKNRGELEEKLGNSNRQVEDLQRQLNESHAKLTNFNAGAEESQKQQAGHKEEIDRLNQQLAGMVRREDLDALKKREEDLTRELENARNEKTHVEGSRNELTKRISELEGQLKESNDKLSNLNSGAEDFRKQEESYKEQIDRLNGQIAAMVSREEFDGLKRREEELLRDLANRSNELETIQRERAELQEKYNKSNEHIGQLESHLSDHKEKLAHASSSTETFQKSEADYKETINKLNEQLANMVNKEEADNLRHKVEELTRELSTAHHEKTGSGEKAEELSRRIEDLEKQLRENNEKLTTSNHNLEEAHKKEAEYKTQIEKLNEKVVHMVSREEFEAVKHREEELTRKYNEQSNQNQAEADKKHEHHTSRIDELERELKEINGKLLTAHKDIEQARTSEGNYKDQLTKLQEQLAATVSKKDFESLKHKEGEVAKERDNLKKELESSDKDRKTLEQKLEKLIKQVGELENQVAESAKKLKAGSANEAEATYKEQIEKLNQKLATMVNKKDFDVLKKKEDELSKERSVFLGERDSAHKYKVQAEKKQKELSQQIEGLEKKLTESAEKLTKSATEVLDAQKVGEKLKQQEEKIKKQLSIMVNRVDFDFVKQQKEELRKELNALKEKLTGSEKEKTMLEKKNESFGKQILELETQVKLKSEELAKASKDTLGDKRSLIVLGVVGIFVLLFVLSKSFS